MIDIALSNRNGHSIKDHFFVVTDYRFAYFIRLNNRTCGHSSKRWGLIRSLFNYRRRRPTHAYAVWIWRMWLFLDFMAKLRIIFKIMACHVMHFDTQKGEMACCPFWPLFWQPNKVLVLVLTHHYSVHFEWNDCRVEYSIFYPYPYFAFAGTPFSQKLNSYLLFIKRHCVRRQGFPIVKQIECHSSMVKTNLLFIFAECK